MAYMICNIKKKAVTLQRQIKINNFLTIYIMKTGITLKKLAKLVYNIADAVATFKNVEPSSLKMIETDIEFTSNLFTHFIITIDENATVRVWVAGNNVQKCVKIDVDLHDSKYYAEIK